METGSETDPMIRVSRLVKRYGGKPVVSGISFEVAEGEVFGLLGPNGAGKTTTMEMIEGLRLPDEGEILVGGIDGIRHRDRVKRIIGVQLQSTALFEHLTVRESLQLYASFYGTAQPLDSLLDSFDLKEKERTLVKHLSGGQRQRLAIALAVVHDPKVLFLDEPTTGLDPQARRGLWEIIRKLKEEGRTIFLSTHYMEEAEQLCDRVAIMDRGEIIALDTPAGLIRGLESESVVEFTAETEAEAAFHRLPGVKEVRRTGDRQRDVILLTDRLQETLSGLITWAGERGVSLKDLRTRTATLEDVFLQRTGKRLTQE
jgi:ABC-2 type transport system ATP-binding protein